MLMPESLERAGEIGSRPPVCTQNTSKKNWKERNQVKSKAEFYIYPLIPAGFPVLLLGL